jgi:hypothetical protein
VATAVGPQVEDREQAFIAVLKSRLVLDAALLKKSKRCNQFDGRNQFVKYECDQFIPISVTGDDPDETDIRTLEEQLKRDFNHEHKPK